MRPTDSSKSDSENTAYLDEVNKFLKSETKFKKFRKSYRYKSILEHLSYRQGLSYFKIIRESKVSKTELIKLAGRNDSIGSPRRFKYDVGLCVSPTTLRYIKVSLDLEKFFGKNLGKVLEIGAGYGGQASILFQTHDIEKYEVIDLEEVQRLIGKYLILLGLSERVGMQNLNSSDFAPDLVISNYAFSELPRELQLEYCQKILSRSKSGYLTMNSGLTDVTGRSKGKMTIAEIQSYLPNSKVLREDPLTGPDNYILVWGHNNNIEQKM
jgi:hypothetical protein